MNKQFLLRLACFTVAGTTSIVGHSAEVDDLQQELDAAKESIRQLQRQVSRIEADNNQNYVLPVSSAGQFEIYGFAQLDYIQDFKRVNPSWEATLRPSRIPTIDDAFGDDGRAILSSRQSRLGVNASLPVGEETLITKLEFDLFGVGSDEGQTTFRLRHAYGEWGPLLAGQTNSLFMDADIFPNTIDYWGPAGMVFLRNPQIRWTPIKGASTFAVALEKPGNDVDTSVVGAAEVVIPDGIRGTEKLPDLTAQYRLTQDWGHFQAAGILRQLSYEYPAAANQEPSDDELGWGINLSTNFKMPSGVIRMSVVSGEGIASYMNDGGMDMAVERLTAKPLDAVPLVGAVAYYDHNWSDQLSSSVGYSFTEVDNQSWQSGGAFDKGEYASVNLLYAPAKQIMMGVEYLWGKRTDYSGDSGSDSRIQFSIKYSFSSLDFGR